MSQADLSAPPRTRLGVAVLVIALHIAAVAALIRAFAPEFTAEVADRVTAVFTVETHPPEPKPPPQPDAPKPAGAAAAAGPRATPREMVPPKPRMVVANPVPAPPIAGSGDDAASGARDAGSGTGAGGQGMGTGAGRDGAGRGGAGAAKAVKVAGDINAARDFPRQTRDLRRGDHVVVALTVGTDGRVKACRVHRPSRDAEADRITCRLATERFRFRPAIDGEGNPVESVYGWQQRWYDPREKDQPSVDRS